MTHTEQITVYQYQKADDGYGGYLPATPTLQANAPTWASIDMVSGDDFVLNNRFTTANQYRVTVNWRDDFTWQRNMFIVTQNYGVLDIEGIRETVRKRRLELDGIYIVGVDDTGSGTPTPISGLTTLYYTVETDAASITLHVLDGVQVYLAFRDGIEKKVVTSNPQINEISINGDVLTLVDGDIFVAGERITILYK